MRALIARLARLVRAKTATMILVLIAVAMAALGRTRKRDSARSSMTPRDNEELANALRPGLQKRAEDARKRAEAEHAAAVERLKDAEAERARVHALSTDDVLRESEEYARKVRARAAGGALVLLAWLLFPAPLVAQDAGIGVVAAKLQGAAGYWVADDVWRAALADAKALEELQAAVPRFEAALAAKNEEVRQANEAAELERAQTGVFALKLKAAEAKLQAAERWWRSPRFLVPLGIVVGAAAVALPMGLAK